ncbi:MAG: type II toxin-antitoxin system RelE/ParE family toxin [Rhodospirillales bacterium]
MARFRLARTAQTDLARILSTSAKRWGPQTARRYATLLAAALRDIAADPEGPMSRDRAELMPGIRSFHIRHARGNHASASVREPAHVLYYRMEPSRHVGTRRRPKKRP